MNNEISMPMVVFAHIVAVVGVPLILFMLSNKVSEKIRNSRYWLVAVIVYLFTVAQVGGAISLLSVYYNSPTLKGEHAMLVIIGIVVAAIAVAFFGNVWRPARRHRKECEDDSF